MTEWIITILCMLGSCQCELAVPPNFYQTTDAVIIDGNLSLTKNGLEFTVKKYVKTYMDFFGYDKEDFIPCEVCFKRANDIHHIDARGMGGNPLGDKDEIENLMALCRKHHDKFGDKTKYKDKLRDIHKNFMDKYGRK